MPTQTPASRRFAPPSSTASVRSSTRPAFSSRFIRPSQTPSSPFPRTQFGGTPSNVDRDGIDAGEGAEDDDDLVEPPSTSAIPRSNQTQQDISRGTNNGDEHPTKGLFQASREPFSQQPEHRQNPPSVIRVTSTAKRRKISHFASTAEAIDDTVELTSSSPPASPSHSSLPHGQPPDRSISDIQILRSSPDPPANSSRPNSGNDDNGSSDLDLHNPSPIAQHLTTPTHTRTTKPVSRFKNPHPNTTAPTQSEPHPTFPSFQSRLLASTSTSTTSPGRHLRGPHPDLDFTLPDVFSPSRKRGNREYIYGGHAEAVRGWILDVAARTSGEKPVSETREKRVVVQGVVARDPAGRFIIVHTAIASATDDTARGDRTSSHWLLTNTDQPFRPHTNTAIASKLNLVNPGSQIIIKGGEAATWQVNLNLNLNLATLLPSKQQSSTAAAAVSHPVGSEDTTPVPSSTNCTVAVLWDIAR